MTSPILTPRIVSVPAFNTIIGDASGFNTPEAELLRGAPHFSVAIVGSGACGLTAALMLKDQGV